MFTGLIQGVSRVREVRRRSEGAWPGGGVRLVVDRPEGWEVAHGESICVNGVCLTHAGGEAAPSHGAASGEGSAASEGPLAFDVIVETLARSTLGDLSAGAGVNLEPSVTPATRMGGHFVQGHVDGVGEVTSVERGADWRVTIRTDAALVPLIVPKGSIAVEGVSLTVASSSPEDRTFEIALIPTTLAETTLGQLEAGRRVNLETDILARTVHHMLARTGGGLMSVGASAAASPEHGGARGAGARATSRSQVTRETLRRAGFVASD